MTKCRECGGNVDTRVLERYEADNELKKMGVVLVDAVKEHACQACGNAAIEIPDLPGLLAAVAVYRVTSPLRLQGHDIRFLRKVLEISAKQFAESLEVSQETVSRWENDKAPMGPANEKLLRLLTAYSLDKRAPGVPWSAEDIGRMKVISVTDPQANKSSMTLYYREMVREKVLEGVWVEKKAA